MANTSAQMPMNNDRRAPQMMRDQLSRPEPSVPNQCSSSGSRVRVEPARGVIEVLFLVVWREPGLAQFEPERGMRQLWNSKLSLRSPKCHR